MRNGENAQAALGWRGLGVGGFENRGCWEAWSFWGGDFGGGVIWKVVLDNPCSANEFVCVVAAAHSHARRVCIPLDHHRFDNDLEG